MPLILTAITMPWKYQFQKLVKTILAMKIIKWISLKPCQTSMIQFFTKIINYLIAIYFCKRGPEAATGGVL